ncbi:Glycosyl transferase CpsG [Streptococcus agalactiae]|uniref:Glycosyl transferase CpsG n=1 Tax=Streptococcus agalactiae TaxID=1311 RepID=A0A8B4RCX1_STRAG|nr:Glycosyl transferase CpsG [Streptococcus agalactiae]
MVPRQEQFGEHVNNHQVDFVNKVKTMYNFDIVVDIERLQNVVYEGTMNRPFLETNRSNFIEEFKVILKELCDENQ